MNDRKSGICDTSFYLKYLYAIIYWLKAVSYQDLLRSFILRRSPYGQIIELQRRSQYVCVIMIAYLITLLCMKCVCCRLDLWRV